MVFQIQGALAEEDREAWRRLAVRRKKLARKAVRGWLKDKLCGLADVLFGALVLYAVASGGMKIGWAILALFLIVGGLCIFLNAGRRPAKGPASPPGQDGSAAGMPGTSVRAAFYGDGCFVFWDGPEKVRLGYSAIAAAWEDGGRFYLFLRDRPPLILPKRHFSGGRTEDFRSFLEGELGRPLEIVQ